MFSCAIDFHYFCRSIHMASFSHVLWCFFFGNYVLLCLQSLSTLCIHKGDLFIWYDVIVVLIGRLVEGVDGLGLLLLCLLISSSYS